MHRWEAAGVSVVMNRLNPDGPLLIEVADTWPQLQEPEAARALAATLVEAAALLEASRA